MELDTYNIIVLIGTVFYFYSYALLSFNKIIGNSYTYITLNLIGALLVLFSLTEHWNLSSIIINTGWTIFSVIGLLNIYYKKKKESKEELELELDISK
jgi:hypothetical protein